MLKEFEIYWSDLTKECQKRMNEFLGLKEGDDNNWELVPFASIVIEEPDPPVEAEIQ